MTMLEGSRYALDCDGFMDSLREETEKCQYFMSLVGPVKGEADDAVDAYLEEMYKDSPKICVTSLEMKDGVGLTRKNLQFLFSL